MKKLLLVLVLIVSSCGYDPASTYKGIVIDEIILSDKKCNYYGIADYKTVLGSTKFRIIDTCSKFNIGDTIKLVK